MNSTQQIINYITSCCNHMGAFSNFDCTESEDVFQFLKHVSSEMAEAPPSPLFPSRYVEHVAYAIDMVASSQFASPPAAIASVYLATRFEFYFRVLSGKLNADGTWKSSKEQDAVAAGCSDRKIKRKLTGKGISSVALAYKIMLLDQSHPVVRHCIALDHSLFPNPISAIGVTVTDIGDRIEASRNAAGHGWWGDISSEAVFYALMTALIFYNQT